MPLLGVSAGANLGLVEADDPLGDEIAVAHDSTAGFAGQIERAGHQFGAHILADGR